MTSASKNLFGESVRASAPAERPKPVQAPAGVAGRGFSDMMAVYTWLLSRGHGKHGVSVDVITGATGLEPARVEAALGELLRLQAVTQGSDGATAIWATVVAIAPPPREHTITQDDVDTYVLHIIDRAGELGTSLHAIADEAGASLDDVRATTANLCRKGLICKPRLGKDYSLAYLPTGEMSPAYISGRFYGNGVWARPHGQPA